MFAPPFRGPFNYVFDPLIPTSLDLVGSTMQARFAAEGKRGVTMREGAAYSAWWNGGLRTSAYFHNQIGLLTETTGEPTPIDLASVPGRAAGDGRFAAADRSAAMAFPSGRAVFDDRESRRAGCGVALPRNAAAERLHHGEKRHRRRQPRFVAGDAGDAESPRSAPARATRGYIIPATQPDFPTATKFVDALLKAGVVVHRAHGRVSRPMAPPIRPARSSSRPRSRSARTCSTCSSRSTIPTTSQPYDIAGWTLALQMGVKFDRMLDAFDGPFDEDRQRRTTARQTMRRTRRRGLLPQPSSERQRDRRQSPAACRRVGLLAARSVDRVRRADRFDLRRPRRRRHATSSRAPRASWACRSARRRPRLTGPSLRLRPVRIGLWDRYGGVGEQRLDSMGARTLRVPVRARVRAEHRPRRSRATRYDVLILPDEAELAARRSNAARHSVAVPQRDRCADGRTQRPGAPPIRGAGRHASSSWGRRRGLPASLGAPVERVEFRRRSGRARCVDPRIDSASARGQPAHRWGLGSSPRWTCSSTTARCFG